MAKLYLKFESAVLKEFTLAQGTLTIGRLPDNNVQIDNLAVSGHHAKISWEADHYVIEDLGSTNGTYVNNARITRVALKNSDMVLVGKHTIQFMDAVAEPKASEKTIPQMAGMDATVVIGRKAAAEVLNSNAATSVGMAAVPARERIGMLTVMAGKTDADTYVLSGKLSVIGKSDMASIKLKGWFAPKVAAVVNKRDGKYFIAASEKDTKVKVNLEEISGQRELTEGDTIEVASVTLAFSYQE